MSDAVSLINKSKNVFLLSDKTTNIYEVSPDFYNKHHLINITKDYKIVNETLVDIVNKEAAVIAAKLDIKNKVETTMSKTKAFISIKDHKNDFENNPKFRLINPAKSQIGHISREILQITKEIKVRPLK